MTTCRCRWTAPSWAGRWRGRCGAAAERSFSFVCLLAAALLGAPAAAAPADDEWYVVQPGDTCRKIARRLFAGDPDALEIWHELNEFGRPPPHRLEPGTRLRRRLPRPPPVADAAQTPDATLAALRPAVNVKPRRAEDWKDGQLGEPLFRLDSVATREQAGAAVEFRDGAEMTLGANALLVIYGQPEPAARRIEKSGAVELVQGDLRLKLSVLRGKVREVPLRTPSAFVAARSRDLALGVDEKRTTRVAVYDGTASVEAGGARVQVRAGFGTKVEEGKRPQAPMPLPPAPKWAGGRERELILVTGPGNAEATLTWAAVRGAVRYRAEVARERRFVDRVLDRLVEGAQERSARVADLEPGRYLARVSALNAAGLASPAGPMRELHVVRFESSAEPGPDGVPVADGMVVLEVNGSDDVELKLDGRLVESPLVVDEFGSHELSIALLESKDVVRRQVQVRPPLVQLLWLPAGAAFDLEARLVDPDGRPAPVNTALEVVGLDGSVVTAATPNEDRSIWRSQVRAAAPGGGGRAGVEVRVQGRALARSWSPAVEAPNPK